MLFNARYTGPGSRDCKREGQVGQRRSMHQMLDRSDTGDHGARDDEREHDESREVFAAMVPIWKPLRRRATAQHEGDGERDRRRDVTEVVQTVGEHAGTR